ncbi:HdeD family acid-resistance protein [Nocardioides mangrovi]|uniref:DUF308 domain-containing protein n=1 Tax=Nocardioides mangrovi TaxID=2874580 RepID=A0ABS7UB68_9ACTN|nr:DUF308 domain-containing protein [Nocardioides mangrovi]MBZ5738234.1 DUF308 domain-containing protein [Nocardioides mangrovi]
MSKHASGHAEVVEVEPLPLGLAQLADHWAWVLAYGLITLGLGIVLVVWPHATVGVFVALLAIQLIVGGVFNIVRALSMSRADGGIRALVGLLGGVCLVVGLLILRDPLQTVVVLGMVLGVLWVVSGVIGIIGAVVAPPPEGRGWELLGGIVSLLGGGFLLVYTDISLHVLVVFVAIWLMVAGLIAVAASLRLRTLGRA